MRRTNVYGHVPKEKSTEKIDGAVALIHSPHGTIRSISAKNSRFFVRTCVSSSLRADRLICLFMALL